MSLNEYKKQVDETVVESMVSFMTEWDDCDYNMEDVESCKEILYTYLDNLYAMVNPNDDDIMKDPYVLEVMTNGASTVVSNEIKSEYFTELAKISKSFEFDTFNYDAVVDALASINKEVEDGLFIVMGTDSKAAIRKDPDYKASKQGEILYTGQFGTICGIPVVCSKLVPADTVYITNKAAVKFFRKKTGTVEQDRDVETKDNTVVYSRYGIMALVDESNSIKMTKKTAA